MKIETATTSRDREFLTRLSRSIVRSSLTTPAVFFLEMTKPLGFIGSQFMIFLGPILGAFIKTDRYYRAATLFERPENIEYVISEIERLDREERKENRNENKR